MRAGGFTIQQALTSDAATIIKQAVTLARRRGHAQVTPLHVAHTLLSSTAGLLRTACLQSHSHPLQCKALELCFNVALNRLPACSSSPMLGPHNSQSPSISNALVAAFKRAQAHQRRGSIESQQQPLLAVKIELEQLIISILDDPSVSRVMREAGFSSTQVKSNVEQAVSLELCSQSTPPSNKHTQNTPPMGKLVNLPRGRGHVRDEDVMSVVEGLSSQKRKNLVLLGECVSSVESVVGGVIEKLEKGDVPEVLRGVKIMNLPISNFGSLSKGEIEMKLGELRSLVRGFLGKGVVLYLGDLKWVAEYRGSDYSGVEKIIVELGRLACGNEERERVWLMGISSFKTYMRCRNGNPSLEAVLGLHPITVPGGNLGLSLIHDSDIQSESSTKKAGNGSSWLQLEGREERQLTCCVDCSAKFESEARSSRNSTFNSESSSSSLPSWLKDENRRLNSNDQDCPSVTELCKKWNSICSSVHKQPKSYERSLSFPSISPSSSTSCFSYDPQNPNLHQTHHAWPSFQTSQPSLKMFISLSNPNSTQNSPSSSDIMETEYTQRFKEFNGENLKTLCSALEKKVPWQKDIVPEIAGTVLQCRSGMIRRKKKLQTNEVKEETWFFFQGVDTQAKEKIARELAKAVFGSHSSFVPIALSSFSSTRADSTDDFRNKRVRDEQSCSYIERFAEAVAINPHRVFFVEDVEQADYCSQMGIKRAIERGRIMNSNGDEVSLSDAIIILSCESFSSRSRACSPPIKQKLDENEEETSPSVSLDLNMSFDDDDDEGIGGEDQSIDDIGLLETVDRCIVFKIQEL